MSVFSKKKQLKTEYLQQIFSKKNLISHSKNLFIEVKLIIYWADSFNVVKTGMYDLIFFFSTKYQTTIINKIYLLLQKNWKS